jgi:hypothetical protein
VQVVEDVQVEGAVLEEAVGEQLDEQEFVNGAVLEEGTSEHEATGAPQQVTTFKDKLILHKATGAPQQVTTIKDKLILPSLAQCEVKWKINNPQQAGKHKWVCILNPENKIYFTSRQRQLHAKCVVPTCHAK